MYSHLAKYVVCFHLSEQIHLSQHLRMNWHLDQLEILSYVCNHNAPAYN